MKTWLNANAIVERIVLLRSPHVPGAHQAGRLAEAVAAFNYRAGNNFHVEEGAIYRRPGYSAVGADQLQTMLADEVVAFNLFMHDADDEGIDPVMNLFP